MSRGAARHTLVSLVSGSGPDCPSPIARGNLDTVITYGTFNNGNVQTQQIIAPSVNRTQTYTYDGVNRLTAASESGGSWSQNFGYDQYGNRWITGAAFPIPSSSGHFGATTNRMTLGSVLYDSAGNVTRQPNGLETMTYDAASRMNAYSDSGTPADNRTYGYDGDGRRVLATTVSSGDRTVYVYDAFGRLAAEYSETAPSGGGLQYRTTDSLGSTRLTTDVTGATTAYYDFKPFGERIGSGIGGRTSLWGDDGGFQQQFTGQERDEESDLDYFGARYFSAGVGRFTSADVPFFDQWKQRPQTWNLYAYGRNNPLRFTDPTGSASYDASGNWVGDFQGEKSCYDDGTCVYWDSVSGAWQGNSTTSDFNPAQNLLGAGKDVLNGFIFFYNLSADVTERTDGIPDGQVDYHRFTYFQPSNAAQQRGMFVASVGGGFTFGGGRSAMRRHLRSGRVRNLEGGTTKVDAVLDGAERWLGKGYKEIAPGIFRSADGLRQVRMRNSDILGQHGGGAHMNFEAFDPSDLGKPVENSHVYLTK